MNKLESRTGEYTLSLCRRLGLWVIELEFFAADKGKTVLHTETNRARAEGVFWYLVGRSDTQKLAERLISQERYD